MRTGIVMLFSACLLLVNSIYASPDSSYQKQWDEWVQSLQDQKAKLLSVLDEAFKKGNSSFETIKKEIEEVYGSNSKQPKPVAQPVTVPGQKK